MIIDLNAQLSGQAFPFMIVFTRLGAGLMLFPGIGEAFVSMRTRMLFALAFTFLLYPVLIPMIPPIPQQPAALVALIASEAVIGIFFGSILRLLMDVVETAGALIAMNTGLSNAMILNPSIAAQSSLTSVFLSTASVALLFISGLDHMLLRGLMNTYALFPVGEALPVSDIAQAFIKTLSQSFVIGVQLASPFVIVGMLVYLTIGVMQRMMPQIQLFLVLLPVQIWSGFVVLSVSIAIILAVWLRSFDEVFASLFVR